MTRAGIVLAVLGVAGLARVAHADPETITFHDAIVRALAHNTDLRIAIDDVARTEGLLDQARSALLPQLTGTAMYTRIPRDIIIAGQRTQAANTFLAQIAVAAPLVDLNAWSDKRRASDNVDVNALTAQSVRRDIAIETAKAYFTAYTAAKYTEIARSARDNARAHVDIALQRRGAGIDNGLDLSRAQSELATDQAQVSSALTSQVRAEQALGVITGTDHALRAASDPDLGDVAAGPGISHRADVILERRRHAAASKSRSMDWTLWAPKLELDADAYYQVPRLEPGFPETGYELDVALTVPLFDGGYRHGLHVQRLALEAEEQERQVGVERQASSDVAVADSVLGQARDAAAAAREASELTAHTLELATEGYKAGTSSSLEVVDAQRASRDSALQAVLADNDYRQAQLDLLAATGAFPPPTP